MALVDAILEERTNLNPGASKVRQKGYSEGPWYMTIDTVFGPVVYDHYRKSKQIRNALLDRLELLNSIQAAVLAASALVLVDFLVRGPRTRPRAFFASLLVIVLVAGNAFALSGPNGRYQSRAIWLVPLLAACVSIGTFARPGLSKTKHVQRLNLQRLPSSHQPRRRRDCFGELVQIDGSELRWSRLFGQLPGKNKLKAGSRLLV
jgi:hypothetical protein